jgi:hypothetical protein
METRIAYWRVLSKMETVFGEGERVWPLEAGSRVNRIVAFLLRMAIN